MPSYSDIERDIEEGIFQVTHTHIKQYGGYTLYVNAKLYDGIMLDLSDFSVDDLVVRNDNKEVISLSELPVEIKDEIIREVM